MKKTPTTPPASEPVTLAEAKAHLCISHDEDDTYIGALIQTAREACEQLTDSSFITQTWTGFSNRFYGEMDFPRGPVQSISSVNYHDSDNAEHTVGSGNYFLADTMGRQCLHLIDWYTTPTVYDRPDAVSVEYVAGYGTSGSYVPAPIRQSMLLLIGSHYAQRESISSANMATVPHAVEFLLSPYMNKDWH